MGERSTSVDLFVFPSQWPARAQHGWVEAIRKGWDGAGQLAGAEREGGIGGSRQLLRGGGRQVLRIRCQPGRQGAGGAGAAA